MVLESLPRRGARDPDGVAARAGVSVRVPLRKQSLLEELGLVVRRDGGYALAPPPDRRAAAAGSSPADGTG